MNARRVARRLVKEFDGAGKRQIGIIGAKSGERRKAGFAFDANAFFDEDGGSAGGAQQGEIAAVGEKSDLSGVGVVHAGDAGDLGGGIAFEAAGKLLCKVREFHQTGS